MPAIKSAVVVAGPLAVVFEKATDLTKWADRVEGIKKLEFLSAQTAGLGTRFRETRVFLGREATEEMEILAFDPPQSYLVGAESHGCRYRSLISFRSVDGGTEMAMTFNSEPLTFMAKVMTFLMRPMMKAMGKMITKDLEDLKTAIEAELAQDH